jgi:hypothetical protein
MDQSINKIKLSSVNLNVDPIKMIGINQNMKEVLNHLHPAAEVTVSIKTVINEIKNIPVEAFDFKTIDNFFQAWLSVFRINHKEIIPKVKEGSKREFPIIFNALTLKWRGTFSAQVFEDDGLKFLSIDVRLPNDGFLYPQPNILKPLEGNEHIIMKYPRHKSSGWIQVHGEEIEKKMPNIYKFLIDTLEEEIKNDFLHAKNFVPNAENFTNLEVEFEFYYNVNCYKMDVKAFLNSKNYGNLIRVNVSFHEGYPEDAKKDRWKGKLFATAETATAKK